MNRGRNRTKALLLAATAALLCRPAAAEITASLTAAEKQEEGVYPYRAAELAVKNDSADAIRAISLRWARGGPTLIYTATIPPRTEQTLRVALPAVSVQQSYVVRMLPADRLDAERIAELRLPVTWPVALVTDQAFVDRQAFLRFALDAPQWPGEAKLAVFAAVALACLGMAATLLAPRAWVRLVLLGVVIAAAIGALDRLCLPRDLVVRKVVPAGADLTADASAGGSLYVVACRRTVEWESPQFLLAPIYYDERDMSGETMVWRPGKGARVLQRPDQVRVFRLRRPMRETSSPEG